MTQEDVLAYISQHRESGSTIKAPIEGIDDKLLDFLVDQWPEMPSLAISDSSITDVGLKSLLAKATKLYRLDLRRIEGVTDKGLQYISKASGLRHLGLLDLLLVTDKGPRDPK